MAAIDKISTVQAGITAPALVDPQAHTPRVDEAKNRQFQETESRDAVVELSREAQIVAQTPTTEQQTGDPSRREAAKETQQSVASKLKSQVDRVQMTDRRTDFDAAKGQVEIRQGDEVIREIPADEVLKIRENIDRFRESQKQVDISA